MAQTWDPDGYARNAGFVARLGKPLIERLAPRRGERILDLGCGDGVLTAALAETGATVVGVDASPEQVAAVRARGLDARVMAAERLSFDGEFDAVFSNAALHWMTDADAVLAGVRRALVAGGRFVGEFGGHGNVAAIRVALAAVIAAHGADPEPQPWFFPTAAAWAERLRRHGFSADDMELYPRPTPLPTGIDGWLETFATGWLERLVPEVRAAARDRVVRLLRPVLCDEAGGWTADYVRLRFSARRVG
ncbi:MAG: methyltransferase domain-containing protein [Rhodospirillales bacterium]